MSNTKVTKILMRNGTTTEWELAPDPRLEQGEIGVEVDTYRMKIGTEDTPEAWDSIGYFAAGITSVQEVDSVHANGLLVDSVGKLDLNIDSVLADVDRIEDELDTVRTKVRDVEHITGMNTGQIYKNDTNIARLDSIKLEDSDLQPIRDQIDSINSYDDSINTINIRLDDLADSVNGQNDSITQISINLGLNVLEVLKNRDSINKLGDSISDHNDLISYLNYSQLLQDTILVRQKDSIESISARLDTVIITNQDQWDSIYYFDSVLVEHRDSITSLDTVKLRSYPGETEAQADNLLKGEVYHNEGLNHAVVVDRIAIPRLANDTDAYSLEPYWSTTQSRHIVKDVYSKNEVDTMSADLSDSIGLIDSILGTVNDSVKSSYYGLVSLKLGQIAQQTMIDGLEQGEVALAAVVSDHGDSIRTLDSVKITQDNIPIAKNRDFASHRADGGKLVRGVAPDGNYKYSYTPSLPLAEIIDSVVGSIGGVPTDTVSAVAAINAFFNIILNNYQPNVTFSVDDYDT